MRQPSLLGPTAMHCTRNCAFRVVQIVSRQKCILGACSWADLLSQASWVHAGRNAAAEVLVLLHGSLCLDIQGLTLNLHLMPLDGHPCVMSWQAAHKCCTWVQLILADFSDISEICLSVQIPANIALVKNLTVHGVYWGSHLQYNPQLLRSSLQELVQWLADGRLQVHVSHRYHPEPAGSQIWDITEDVGMHHLEDAICL